MAVSRMKTAGFSRWIKERKTMLRRENTHSLHWTDKTLSMLRASQLEACEKELAGLPSRCLFDAASTDLDAEDFFDLSFYAREPHSVCLHTIEGLRALVLENFSAEIALLSVPEHEVLTRLCLTGGHLPLRSEDDHFAAVSLVRRLWCRVSREGESLLLHLPNQLWLAAVLLLADEEHQKIREIVEKVDQVIEDSLYLLGALPIRGPMHHLEFLLQGSSLAKTPEITSAMISRLIHTAYDYIITREGQTLLVHSGFAEPDQLSPTLFQGIGLYGMDEPALSDALQSMDAIEDELFYRMEGLLNGSVRPEITPWDAVEDLQILAKQNVSMKDMEDVLSSLLIQRPTPEMLRALRDIHDLTPRWLSLSASLVQ